MTLSPSSMCHDKYKKEIVDEEVIVLKRESNPFDTSLFGLQQVHSLLVSRNYALIAPTER